MGMDIRPTGYIRLCSRCGAEPPRAKDQRYCQGCNAAAARRFRVRRRLEVAALKEEIELLRRRIRELEK